MTLGRGAPIYSYSLEGTHTVLYTHPYKRICETLMLNPLNSLILTINLSTQHDICSKYFVLHIFLPK